MGLSTTQHKKEKLKELIWYICENYNQRLFETKLWKLIFFCDADYFQKYGEIITAVPYIKNHRGPTPVYGVAGAAISELVDGGYIVRGENAVFVAIKNYDLKYLDSKQIDAINTTCDKYYKLSTNQICTLAHRDPVYLAAEKLNDVLDFSFVTYRDDGSDDGESCAECPSDTVSFSKEAKESLLNIALA